MRAVTIQVVVFKTGVQMLLHLFTGKLIMEKELVYATQFMYVYIFKTRKAAYPFNCTILIKISI